MGLTYTNLYPPITDPPPTPYPLLIPIEMFLIGIVSTSDIIAYIMENALLIDISMLIDIIVSTNRQYHI